jgi:hypothetical protein
MNFISQDQSQSQHLHCFFYPNHLQTFSQQINSNYQNSNLICFESFQASHFI